MEKENININVALEPNYGTEEAKAEFGEVMTEQDFYIEEFAKLKEQKTGLDKRVKEVSDWLKTYMKELSTDSIENNNYELKLSESTASVIKASDLLREIGMRIPADGEEIINELFKVNITEAKKKVGALALNKIMTAGDTTTTMRIKKK